MLKEPSDGSRNRSTTAGVVVKKPSRELTIPRERLEHSPYFCTSGCILRMGSRRARPIHYGVNPRGREGSERSDDLADRIGAVERKKEHWRKSHGEMISIGNEHAARGVGIDAGT